MSDNKPTQRDLRFARNLKRIRKSKDLTQEKLAEKSRLSTTFIGLLETGKRRPSLDTIRKLANVLDVKSRDLLPD